jgi:FkbM family methyltransferase
MKKKTKTVHHHTFREDLLKEGGWVLDLGCNDFIFSSFMINRGMKVIGLDPIKNINIPDDIKNNKNFTYLQRACVGIKESDTATYYEYQSWGANSLVNTPDLLHRERNGGHAKNPYKDSYQVPITTINELMEEFNIIKFDYIKIDIEGGEYEILANFPKECTKQFSVEYHDFLGLNPTDDVEHYHKDLIENVLTNFSIESENKTEMKNKGTYQRDDVLYVQKQYL